MVAVSIAGCAFLAGRQTGERREDVPLPLIVERLEAIRELKTARLHLSQPYVLRSHREPNALVAWFPPARDVSYHLTANELWAEAQATIEAGVDLRHADLRYEEDALIIELAPPKLSEPNVTTQHTMWKQGRLWADPRLPFEVEKQMRVQARRAAQTQELLAKAKEEAEVSLTALLGPVVKRPVRVIWSDAS